MHFDQVDGDAGVFATETAGTNTSTNDLAAFLGAGVTDGGYATFSSAAIGGGGRFTEQSPGTCNLSAGTCNAVVPGALGSSSCYCDFQGGNWAIDSGAFTCHARADAGSATVWVRAGATAMPGTATIGVHCDN